MYYCVLTRYNGEVREPLLWRQGSQVSMRVARRSASLLLSHSPIPGILQARTLEWVAISFSNA